MKSIAPPIVRTKHWHLNLQPTLSTTNKIKLKWRLV